MTEPGVDYRIISADHVKVEERGMLGHRTAETWATSIADWSLWMHAQNRSPNTVRQWRWILTRYAEDHLHRSPWKITTEQIYTWYASRGWAPATMRGARSAVRSFYGWAQLAGRCRRNPARELPSIVMPPGLPRPATEEAIDRALERATDKLQLMILFGAKAGLRCAEIATLRWTDVGPVAFRVTGKGGRERIIDLHPDLAAALATERARRRAGTYGTGWKRRTTGGLTWVFPGRCGHAAPRWVSQQVSVALGPGVTAHMLRHRAGTRGLEATHDLAAVQEVLGHASPATTRIYTLVSGEARRSVIDAL